MVATWRPAPSPILRHGDLAVWPFTERTETRSSGDGYEGAILRAFEAQATATPRAQATAALEAASSLIARCLASATVEGPAHLAAAVSPAVLAQAGRSLIRQGQQVFEIDVTAAGTVRLLTAGHHDVYGPADPEYWTYRTSVYGPSGTTTRHLPADGVLHFRYLTEPSRPWFGISPLRAASIAGRLSAEVSQALADEVSGPRGSLLPLPTDGDDPSVAELKRDIRTLGGKVGFVESTRTMNPGAPGSNPQDDWKPRRLGGNPPASEVDLLGRAFVEVLAACGIPPGLFSREADAGQRESMRRFLHTTLEPLAGLIAMELSEKLEAPISLNLDRIRASDLAGKARAFGSMVKAGLAVERAAMLAGLMAADEAEQ